MSKKAGKNFGPETSICVRGVELRCPAYPGGCSYVRLCDSRGEFAYWDVAEWAESPEEVMGAIIGALKNGRRQYDRTP
jgi:hypothetical protein